MKRITAGLFCMMAFAVYAIAQPGEVEMRRVECAKLIVYTPIKDTSDDQVCAGFGGVVADRANDRESMTILVKGLKVGSDDGLKMAALPSAHQKQ
ncbi:hypothetical protein C8N35_102450 [Breoghania corrubedonensis]|uniref:Uncharacterized protein n=1 Tax=Breoghania corrubedonensis TaxID=665038 RepID=A0A2T5VDC4_9HYPH|nr:hypothetical protein [Breoghania corrubedonensis]PTW61734.1 hypothetical protein C8N35_102450 [Breoghania corrubedonensis]